MNKALCIILFAVYKFVGQMSDKTVLEGDTVNFQCQIDPVTAPVSWKLGNRQLKSGDRFDMKSQGADRNLVIKNCQLSDTGQVTAETGSEQIQARLIVLGLIL